MHKHLLNGRVFLLWLLTVTLAVLPLLAPLPVLAHTPQQPVTVEHSAHDFHCSEMSTQTEIASVSTDHSDSHSPCCSPDFHLCCSPLIAMDNPFTVVTRNDARRGEFPSVLLEDPQTTPHGLYRPPLA